VWGSEIGRSCGNFVGPESIRILQEPLLAGDTLIGQKGLEMSRQVEVLENSR
jgi:hypothetical protein